MRALLLGLALIVCTGCVGAWGPDVPRPIYYPPVVVAPAPVIIYPYPYAYPCCWAPYYGWHGFITKEELRKKFGDTVTTRGLAICYGMLRVVKEVDRPQDGGGIQRGYEWSDERFSNQKMKDLPEWMGPIKGLLQGKKVRYTGYEAVTVRCRWTNKVLAGMIDPADLEKRVFDIDPITKEILVPAYCLTAMFRDAFQLVPALADKPQAIAYRVKFAAVRIPDAKDKIQDEYFPVAPEYRGGKGKGRTATQVLPAGTEFTIDAMIPTSEISVAQYLEVIQTAGKYVRLSPGRSSGRGDFEVLG
jgi:hypothetical protein